jgi:hypothetical protein
MSLKYYGNREDNIEVKRVSRTMMKAPEVVFGVDAKKEMKDLQEAAAFFDDMYM